MGWLLVLVLAAVKGEAKKPKLALDLRVTPRIAYLGQTPLHVQAFVEVTDPNHDLYCPEVTWDWGDETKSSHQEDCDFYQPGDPEFPNQIIYKGDHYYKQTGTMTITVKLKAATKTQVQTQSVEIR